MGTGAQAVPAADALRMVGCFANVYIHLAYPGTGPAGGALVPVDGEAAERHRVEQGVKGTQRTQPLAKGAVEKDCQRDNAQKDAELPGKQGAQRASDPAVGNGQRDGALQHPRRTQPFAEPGAAHAHLVHHRHGQDDDKQDQDDVFQTGQGAEPLGTELFAGYFVQQLLEPAEGTQKAADRPPQQYAER